MSKFVKVLIWKILTSMINRCDIKKGNLLVSVRGGVRIVVGTIVGDLEDFDNTVYYQAHGDDMMYHVSLASIREHYSIEHKKDEVKKHPARFVRHFSNKVCIMRRLNRI